MSKSGGVRFSRAWAMPSGDTCSIGPVATLLDRVLDMLKVLVPLVITLYAVYLTKGLQWLIGATPLPVRPLVTAILGALVGFALNWAFPSGIPPDVGTSLGAVLGLAGHQLNQAAPMAKAA